MAQDRKNIRFTAVFPYLRSMDTGVPQPANDPLNFYRSMVSALIPIIVQLVRAVIELEKTLSERRRRRLEGLDSISSMEPWSPDEGEEEEAPSLFSPDSPLREQQEAEGEGEGAEASKKRKHVDNSDAKTASKKYKRESDSRPSENDKRVSDSSSSKKDKRESDSR